MLTDKKYKKAYLQDFGEENLIIEIYISYP